MIAGIVLGHYADKWAGNDTPWFTILGLLAGSFAGFSLLLRMIKKVGNGKDSEFD